MSADLVILSSQRHRAIKLTPSIRPDRTDPGVRKAVLAEMQAIECAVETLLALGPVAPRTVTPEFLARVRMWGAECAALRCRAEFSDATDGEDLA